MSNVLRKSIRHLNQTRQSRLYYDIILYYITQDRRKPFPGVSGNPELRLLDYVITIAFDVYVLVFDILIYFFPLNAILWM